MEKIRVGINGMGRIGRTVFRLMLDHPGIEIAGINDLLPVDTLVHLIRYDTVQGVLNRKVTAGTDHIVIGEKKIPVCHSTSPSGIPCAEWRTDVMIESSGKFKKRHELEQYLEAGAKKVLLSCPSEEEVDRTVILGVNGHELVREDRIISNASCTSNCVCSVLHVLQKEFGIVSAFLNTVHPMTNNQNLTDAGHKDLRRSRAACSNIIPTTTSAVRAIWKVMPELKDRFDGIATRVPVLDGALSELVVVLNRQSSAGEINSVFKESSETYMKGIIRYTSDPIVSSDIIGDPHSAVFDSLSTKVIGGNTAQLIAWYDNEYGYSNRITDLLIRIGR